MRVDVREASRQVELDRVELRRELGAGAADLMQSDLDPSGRQFTVGGQVDDVLFLRGRAVRRV